MICSAAPDWYSDKARKQEKSAVYPLSQRKSVTFIAYMCFLLQDYSFFENIEDQSELSICPFKIAKYIVTFFAMWQNFSKESKTYLFLNCTFLLSFIP